MRYGSCWPLPNVATSSPVHTTSPLKMASSSSSVPFTKAQHEQLMKDYEKLSPSASSAVNATLANYIINTKQHKRVIFVLESVPLHDPVLPLMRGWIDEAAALDHLHCQ